MGRQESIARSITLAITNGFKKRSASPIAAILSAFATFFTLYQLILRKYRPADFANLRRNHWNVTDDDYVESFHPSDSQGKGDALHTIGDMGFSGSTFYSTADQKYLVKSVPRHSEHSFFRDDLLTPYVQYMATHSRTLLVRICDFLRVEGISLGRVLRLAPSHHIVMDNVMYGQEQAKKKGQLEWEYWDLKPTSYFYPERDIAEGALTSEATKSQLADEFHDKIVLSKEQEEEFFRILEEDTKLLAEHNAVDYSLFLVRIKVEDKTAEQVIDGSGEGSSNAQAQEDVIPNDPPSVPPGPPSWRTGIPSADGKHLYRAAILDFFWAKHKVQPRFMTFLVNTWNLLISNNGPMSITTTPDEYRERFLKMCRKFVEVVDSESES